jgi:hypothetical protein
MEIPNTKRERSLGWQTIQPPRRYSCPLFLCSARDTASRVQHAIRLPVVAGHNVFIISIIPGNLIARAAICCKRVEQYSSSRLGERWRRKDFVPIGIGLVAGLRKRHSQHGARADARKRTREPNPGNEPWETNQRTNDRSGEPPLHPAFCVLKLISAGHFG